MATLGVDGLVSGLDTTALINQLMQLESGTQNRLKERVSAVGSLTSLLQSVNTKTLALGTAIDKLSAAATWDARSVTATGSSVRATVVSGTGVTPASLGGHVVDVTSLAASHSSYSAQTYPDTDTTQIASVVITSNGQTVTVPASGGGGSLGEIVSAINAAQALGVTASAVRTADGSFRLLMRATSSGADAVFTADVEGVPATVGVQGADAVFTVDGLQVSRSTNSVPDVLDGLTLDLTAVGTTSLTVAEDPGAVADKVKNLVDTANLVLTTIGNASAYDPVTKKGGLLLSNSVTRGLTGSLLSAVGDLTGSLASMGLQTTREGGLVFDREAFLGAYARDPAAVRTALAPEDGSGGLAVALKSVVTAATDANTGSLTQAISGQQSTSRDLTAQIESWDDRLALRRQTLQRQFSALEVALGRLNNQSSWLSGQLSNLASNN